MIVMLGMATTAMSEVLLDVQGFEGYTVGNLNGQNGWSSTGQVYDGTASVWAGVYKDSQNQQIPNMPGIALACTGKESRHGILGGTSTSAYTVTYSHYLYEWGAGVTSFDCQLEQYDAGFHYPITVRLTNVVDSNYFRVQALQADGSGNIIATLYDSYVDDGVRFLNTARIRLDIALAVDLVTDTYDLKITEWTPGTWNSGTPVQVLTADDLEMASIETVGLTAIRYIGRASGSAWTMCDNVVVELVPEPATMTLLVLGGLGCLRLRRRK